MTFEEAYGLLNLEADLIPEGLSNRSGRTIQANFITIHNTDNDAAGADAHAHARYLKGDDARERQVSWHFTVDDKCCVKHLPIRERGLHAGSALGNTMSIGIEICEHAGVNHEIANDRAALLAAVLMQALAIPPENIVPHKHWSGKNCPHLLLRNGGSGFNQLVERATNYLTQLVSMAGMASSVLLDGEEAVEMDTTGTTDHIRVGKREFVLNARPDTLDFRDKMYEAALNEVPPQVPLASYQKWGAPILDQGQEGACTGFGLATVANYLLRRRRVGSSKTPVSPRMFYDLARRYDEWPGERYDGSSARGAMKGWHKHGVCSEARWPYQVGRSDGRLTDERAKDAAERPLGAYYRVNHKDLVCMHSALAEVGVLYATALVHEGWSDVDAKGNIPYPRQRQGGHAFAIVAYDSAGFWIQNSWGPDWGKNGFARISYDDWLENGTDVWVARLGAPVHLRTAEGTSASRWSAVTRSEAYAYQDLRPHIISIGNDGRLRKSGTYGTNETDVAEILTKDFREITKNWTRKRLLLYAHGGLVPETTAIQRVADHRATLLQAEVYPLSFIWKSDLWTTLSNILEDALRRRRPEGFLDSTKDFLLDRLDDALEPLARSLTGKMQWDEMKENALRATSGKAGGARIAAEFIDQLIADDPAVELHVVGHSAGGVFQAPLVQLLTQKGKIAAGPMRGEQGYGRKIVSCTLWAPANTVDLFKQTFLPAIQDKSIERFGLFTLTDKAERDDNCAGIYNKSLLYLVSNAFEARPRIPLFRDSGTPIVGMEKFIRADAELKKLFASKAADWVLSPNAKPDSSPGHAEAHHHGDFDDDQATLKATLARILGADKVGGPFSIHRSESSLRDRRLDIVYSSGTKREQTLSGVN